MDAGELVGDDVMIGIVGERLKRPDTVPGFVLDGFPRTMPQADALDAIMEGRGPLVVVDIVVPEDVLLRRLAARRICGSLRRQRADRVDDDLRRVRRRAWCTAPTTATGSWTERLKVYHRQTRPIVEFYSARPTFRTIDGNQPPDVVTASMDAAIREASVAAPGGVRL